MLWRSCASFDADRFARLQRYLLVLRYRTFRNDDPPELLELWNETFTGRSAYPLHSTLTIERCAFSKPYFDPAGFFIAEAEGSVVGFAHAGFGPDPRESRISTHVGVVCAIGVRPAYRGQGIGSALLEHAEAYLKKKRVRSLLAGQMRPNSPFYFGLYGGSDLPGFLGSDELIGPFLEARGYYPCETCSVLHRRLNLPAPAADKRFAALRRRFDLRVVPHIPLGTWWSEAVLGLFEPVEFRLEEKFSGIPAVRASIWEMDGFSAHWKEPMVGILDLNVQEPLRRQGLGKFFVALLLQYLQEQCFNLVEIQVSERNRPAMSLFQSLGFEQIDIGRVYRSDK